MDNVREAIVQEARELLELMEQTLARVVADGGSPDAVNELFRVAHTIKGSAGILALDHIVSFTHVLEAGLDHLRSNDLPLDASGVALLTDCGDYLAELVDAIAAHREHIEPDSRKRAGLEAALAAMRTVGPAPAQPAAGPSPGRSILGQAPATAGPGGMMAPSPPTHAQTPDSENTSSDHDADAGLAYVRVPVRRMDALTDLVGELVIASASANELARRQADRRITESVDAIAGLVAQMRDDVLGLRMIPIGEVFHRFPRVVRKEARLLGKEIRLTMEGADTGLDKSMIERLSEPLLHIVRNAIDHGLEPVSERVAAGKPAAGTLHLNAYHDAGSVVIEVSDDGRGLDYERMQRKAVECGLLDAAATPSEEQLQRLLFEPGFSTKREVTRLSGRGVGMDVVRQSIAALGGETTLINRPGRGLKVRMRLPLTLAIIDGFRVGVGGSIYVLPMGMVVECIDLRSLEMRGSTCYLRDEALPWLRLRDVFGLPDAAGGRESMVLVEYGRGQRAGLVVDRLLGEFQTVIKPLGMLFEEIESLMGFTILADGQIALILNVPRLILRAMGGCAGTRINAMAPVVHGNEDMPCGG